MSDTIALITVDSPDGDADDSSTADPLSLPVAEEFGRAELTPETKQCKRARCRIINCCSPDYRWAGCCCLWSSEKFIKGRLLFEDRALEVKYLSTMKGTMLSKVAVPVVTLWSLLIVLGWQLGFVTLQLPSGLIIASTVAAAMVFVFALVINFPAKAIQDIRYQLSVTAAIVALLFADVAAVFSAKMGSVDSTVTSPMLTWLLAIPWLCQIVNFVGDIFAARLFGTLGILNVALLLVVCLTVTISSEYSIGVMLSYTASVTGSFIALVLVLRRRELAQREIFAWNHMTTDTVGYLSKAANPFDVQYLREWISRSEESQSSSDAASSGDADLDENRRAFWEIPPSALRLNHQLAAGGGGVVWKADFQGNVVAAKQVFLKVDDSNDNLHELSAEVAVLAQLSHENIVRFLGLCRCDSRATTDAVSTSNALMIVQEYCPLDLRKLLEEQLPRMPTDEWVATVRRLAEEIARGMNYLHSREVEHNDLKPENILLSAECDVRIADFGVSQQFLSTSSTVHPLAFDGCTSGTPEYMPPEDLGFSRDSMDSSGPSQSRKPGDVYAFGVVLWELLCSGASASGASDPAQMLRELANDNIALGAAVHNGATELSKDLVREQWQTPPPSHVCGQSPDVLRRVMERSYTFYRHERPKFDAILKQLGCNGASGAPDMQASNDFSEREARLDEEIGVASRPQLQMAVPRKSTSDSVDTFTTTKSLTRVMRFTFIRICACPCWTRRGLRFSRLGEETRYMAYMHSEQFFEGLRTAYVAFALMNLIALITSAFPYQPPSLISVPQSIPLLSSSRRVILFCVGAVIAWVPSWRQRSYSIFFAVGFIGLVAEAVLTLYITFEVLPLMTENVPFVCNDTCSGNSTPCLPHCMLEGNSTYLCLEPILNGTCSLSLLETKAVAFEAWFNIPLLNSLTAAVTILILGLPCYQYVVLLLISGVTYWTLVAQVGYIVFYNLHGGATDQALFFSLVVAGITIYSICAASAVSQEKTSRALFRTYCSLFEEEKEVRFRAAFRGYRQALMANRQYLSGDLEIGNFATRRPRHRIHSTPLIATALNVK